MLVRSTAASDSSMAALASAADSFFLSASASRSFWRMRSVNVSLRP